MLAFEQNASLIVTDSGGVQKEAYFFKVPCITLRDQTEWTELVRLGWNRLVDVVEDNVVTKALDFIGSKGDASLSPYGSGCTSNTIAKHLAKVTSL